MEIYILLVIIILVGGAINSKATNKKNAKLIYCVIVGIIMFIVMGFRHIDLGMTDTKVVYVPAFKSMIYMNFSDSMNIYGKDMLFFLFAKLFTYISYNENIWIMFVSIPLIYSTTKIIYKYSKIPSLSFIMFLSLNYYGMNFTLMRHSVALAFIILSYPYLKERKLVKFVIYVLLASCFHSTAIVFLLAYPLAKVKFNWKQILVILGILVISVGAKNQILQLISIVFNEGRFQNYATGSVSIGLIPFIINTLIIIVSYVFCKLKKEENEDINILLNISSISSLFLTLTQLIGEAYRMAMFFGIFNILLLPNVLEKEKKMENKYIIYIMAYGIFILYFLMYSLKNAAIVPYKFFWQ